MQKASLIAALALTIGAAYFAYPKSGTPSIRKIAISPADQEELTALEKLRLATKGGGLAVEAQSVLPAPRVVDHVKQEIQTRPAAAVETVRAKSDNATAANATAAPGPGTAVSASPPMRSGITGTTLASPPAAASEVPSSGIEKLAARLPAQAEPPAAIVAAPSPAATGPAKLLLPSTAGTVATPTRAALAPDSTAPGTLATPTSAAPASVAPASGVPDAGAQESADVSKPRKVERRRPINPAASGPARPRPAESATRAQSQRTINISGRLEGS
jgi:hypothetical protein